MFQTFTISDWNLMYKEVFGVGRDIPTSLKVKRLANVIAATTLMNVFFEDVLGINSPFPTPVRTAMTAKEEGKSEGDIILEIVKSFGEPIPGIGGAFKYGGGATGAVIDNFNYLFTSWSDRDYRSSLLPKDMDKGFPKKAAKFAETAVKLKGVPFSGQAAKMIRAAKRGETPYGMIQGSFDPDKKKKSSFKY
jgi:hypothetical protein